jgi:hypothetical protein
MRAQGKSGVYWTHHNGTQIVEIERDIVNVKHTPSPSAVCVPREPGYGREMFLRVHYLDRVEKRDGVWKIAHRRVVYSPCHIVQIEEEFLLSLFSECLHDAGFPKDEVYKWQETSK